MVKVYTANTTSATHREHISLNVFQVVQNMLQGQQILRTLLCCASKLIGAIPRERSWRQGACVCVCLSVCLCVCVALYVCLCVCV